MKQSPEPLKQFYRNKRTQCYESVGSFKYPFTGFITSVLPWYSNVSAKLIDMVQVIRLYEMSYVAVRTIDDIADEGDIDTGVAHLKQVVNFLTTDRNAITENELLLQYIFDTASIIGRDVAVLQQAFLNVFNCVAGDVARRAQHAHGTPEIRSQSDIEQYVKTMEHDGIFRLIFELFGEYAVQHEQIWPLVRAGRWHFYLLRDVVEDVAEGLINIPPEFLPDDIPVMVTFCKTLERVPDTNMKQRLHKIRALMVEYPKIGVWVTEQISAGEASLIEYRKQPAQPVSWRARLLLRGSHRRTARFFRQARKELVSQIG